MIDADTATADDFFRIGKAGNVPICFQHMLTNALRELEADGFINRVQFNEIPPHVEYSLTEKGKDLMPIFYEIMKWGFKHEND